jgi:hypothetical protein
MEMQPIGTIHTPYSETAGMPIQPAGAAGSSTKENAICVSWAKRPAQPGAFAAYRPNCARGVNEPYLVRKFIDTQLQNWHTFF